MNHAIQLKPPSRPILTPLSLPASLRWLRRAMTLLLIVANFAIAMWSR